MTNDPQLLQRVAENYFSGGVRDYLLALSKKHASRPKVKPETELETEIEIESEETAIIEEN